MRPFALLVCVFGPAAGARAHETDMPVVAHVARHGGLLLAPTALVTMILPLLGRRC
jgi:hypothetical protein